jgi:hypothetical protein
MHSVRCVIWDKARPDDVWVEIEIGRDDAGQRFWKLTDAGKIPFNQFKAKQGTWQYVNIQEVGPDGREMHTRGIAVDGVYPDTFTLKGVPKGFYRLTCGQTLSGDGSRDADGTDVEHSMDFLCT